MENITTFQELLKHSGKTMKWFSDRWGIPYRTVQDWKSGKGHCPDYVLRMMIEILISEQ